MSEPSVAESTLAQIVARVRPPGQGDATSIRTHLDALTKPRGSLGAVEALALRLATIGGDPPPGLVPRTVYVLAGDHAVAARGVSAYPAEVTLQMCANIAGGGAAVSVLARVTGTRLVVADLGVAAPTPEGVLDRKVRWGAGDITSEPAMSREEAVAAVLAGAGLVRSTTPAPQLVLLGEMGIGNSTPAAALTALLTGAPVEEVVGRGTGVDQDGLERKRAVVAAAVARARTADGTTGGGGVDADPATTEAADPLEILRQVGGLEIAGLVGVTLAAAARGVPVLIDGYITTAAALVAARVAPAAAGYLVASHRSEEPGHAVLLDALGLEPLLALGLRLGEGSGALLALPLLDAAGALLREMATFSEAGVSDRGAPSEGSA